MAVKDVDFYRADLANTYLGSQSADFAEFQPGWLILLTEATDERQARSWDFDMDLVVVRPSGVAYPGHATPGNGAKRVQLNFTSGSAAIVMTNVDDIGFELGWAIVTKGDFVVAVRQAVISTISVKPT